MKIQYASDLHLEMPSNKGHFDLYPLIPSADILLLAGDITYLTDHHLNSKIISQMATDYKEVFIIPGNHEFYGKHFAIEKIFPSLNWQIRDNIRYINNEVIIRDNVRILFSTLFAQVDDDRASFIAKRINDFYGCRYSEDSMKTFTISEFNECHAKCKQFLQTELEKPFEGQTIVVTHFAPFGKEWIIDYPEFPFDLSDFFHVDLSIWCKQYKIDHWISGHTHIHFDSFQIGDTWMHGNMLGYVGHGEHQNFRRDAIIEI
jgi:3',5'-cyclic AMP phosphodiesterase CpdA